MASKVPKDFDKLVTSRYELLLFPVILLPALNILRMINNIFIIL